MKKVKESVKPVFLIGYILAGCGVILFALNFILGWTFNIALPLVFLVLGVCFLMLSPYWKTKWKWFAFLTIPGATLIAFGVIFLLNILTSDWAAWAYAWLLLLTGIGVGMILANQDQAWTFLITLIGWGLTIASITFFVIFGAIAGGIFIKVFAPILIVLAGIILIGIQRGNILPKNILARLHSSPTTLADADQPVGKMDLIEPLSSREIEVIQLIDQGFSNQQIADKMSIAASTVKTHINNIYGKLGVQTRVQAINRARRLNIIDPH